MRTEVKLALGIVVGVIIIAAAWWILAGPSSKKPKTPASGFVEPGKRHKGPTNVVEVLPGGSTTETPTAEVPETPLIQPVYQPATEPSGQAVTAPTEAPSETPAEAPSATEVPSRVARPGAMPAPSERSGFTEAEQNAPAVEPAPGTSPLAINPREGTTATDRLTGKRYYVVKKGDTGGFWGISKTVYGTGRYMKAIQQANPNLDPRKLRVGQKVWLPSEEILSSYTTPKRVIRKAPIKTVTNTAKKTTGIYTGAPVSTTLPDGRVFD